MYKVFALMVTVLTVVMMGSGCALISRHTEPVEGGTKTTVGILGFDAIDNGSPMIPCYMRYDLTK